MKTKGHFAMAASRIKTSLLENTPGEIPNHIETSQSTRLANHNTGLHQKYLQADHNGTFQDIKKKDRKSLVGPESYLENP